MQPKENYMYYCAIISKIFYEKNKNLAFLWIQYYFFLDIHLHKLVRSDASGKRNLSIKENRVLESHFLFVLFEFNIMYIYNLSYKQKLQDYKINQNYTSKQVGDQQRGV